MKSYYYCRYLVHVGIVNESNYVKHFRLQNMNKEHCIYYRVSLCYATIFTYVYHYLHVSTTHFIRPNLPT